jgi:hypothetical protein
VPPSAGAGGHALSDTGLQSGTTYADEAEEMEDVWTRATLAAEITAQLFSLCRASHRARDRSALASMLAKAAELGAGREDADGNTPLMVCVAHGWAEGVQACLEQPVLRLNLDAQNHEVRSEACQILSIASQWCEV